MDQSITGRMLVKKLFKLLSLLRLFRELRYTMRGHGHHRGHYRRGGYGHSSYGDHWHPRSREYHPLHRRSRKPKLKHLVADLLSSRRY
jgi:hypothetical protein